MVCVPCFVIPALLFIFRVIIQPLYYRIWGRQIQEPALSCPMPQRKKIKSEDEVKIPESKIPESSIKEVEKLEKVD